MQHYRQAGGTMARQDRAHQRIPEHAVAESAREAQQLAYRLESGGPVDVSYLGSDCSGFAEPNPDLEAHYTVNGHSLLRIYFIADTPGDDATLIVNDASGDWHCSDDAYGTSNPSIDFNSPEQGWYDIWIGSYSARDYIAGTLYITELDSKHP
jgi:hypothetical protein